MQPHAHYRAREVKAWATLPDGARRWLIRIQNWDFNWQDQYRYANRSGCRPARRLEMEYVFDNSDRNPRNPIRPPHASHGDGARRTRWAISGFRP